MVFDHHESQLITTIINGYQPLLVQRVNHGSTISGLRSQAVRTALIPWITSAHAGTPR